MWIEIKMPNASRPSYALLGHMANNKGGRAKIADQHERFKFIINFRNPLCVAQKLILEMGIRVRVRLVFKQM